MKVSVAAAFAVGSVLLACALPTPAASGPTFGEYLQSHYTAAERGCENLGDADSGWCFTAATKVRDLRIAAEVHPTKDVAGFDYQRAWLKYRATRCAAIGGTTGSGAGTIAAECMLDMAIARQLELEGTSEGSI